MMPGQVTDALDRLFVGRDLFSVDKILMPGKLFRLYRRELGLHKGSCRDLDVCYGGVLVQEGDVGGIELVVGSSK